MLAAMEIAGLDYPVVWLDGALHNSPRRLHAALAESLDSLRDSDQVILTYGLCGRAAEGLRSAGPRLILPRVDDCAALLLGSQAVRDELGRDGCFFVTHSWLNSEGGPAAEYQRTAAKYGQEAGRRVMRAMFGHYHQLVLLDTGRRPLSEAMPAARRLGELLELEVRVTPATLSYLVELLTGPWPPEKFLVVEPGETVTGERLRQGRAARTAAQAPRTR